MYNQIRKSLSGVFPLFVLAMAFMSAQIASADGNEVAIEMIVLRAEQQRIDIDGDGELETFSANLMVLADGTAEGFIQLDNDAITVVESGSIIETAAGDLIITAQNNSQGSAIHKMKLLGYDPELPGNGGGDDDDGPDIILWDVVGASGQVHTFDVAVEISIR